MQEMDRFTKTGALKIVETVLGFPNPASKKLAWYFDEHDGMYVPRVDFSALKAELDAKKMVARLGNVVHLPQSDQRRQAVMLDICNVIKKHEL